MAYEPTQLALFKSLYSQMGWFERDDFRQTCNEDDSRTLGHGTSLGSGLWTTGTSRRTWWERATTYAGRGLGASLVAALIFTPVFIENRVVNLPRIETSEQKLVKKVYTELASKMFEQLDPPEIMSLAGVIVDESSKAGVDPFFIIAVIEAESNFNVEAISPCGARGLMQLMPATFKSIDGRRAFDPNDNVKAGIKYIGKLVSQGFVKFDFVLLAYNQGPNSAVSVAKGEIEQSEETKSYIRRVKAIYERLLTQSDFDKQVISKRLKVAKL